MLLSSGLYAKKPDWLNATQKGCRKNEMCGVGEGPSRILAEAAAKSSIAKVFKTKIKATFLSNLAEINKEVIESSSESIQEVIDEELEGVSIKEIYESETGFFALAALDKSKYGKNIKSKMDEINTQIESEFEQRTIGAVVKAESLIFKREALKARFQILTGFNSTFKIELKDVLQEKFKLLDRVLIFIVADNKASDDIVEIVQANLASFGYEFTKDEHKMTSKVQIDVTTKEDYLQVVGFKKFNYTISLKAFDKNGDNSGTLVFDRSEGGRSEKQAKSKMISNFKNYLRENITELKIK